MHINTSAHVLNRLTKPTLKNSPHLELVCERSDWGEELLYHSCFLDNSHGGDQGYKVCVLLYAVNMVYRVVFVAQGWNVVL